MLQTIERKQDKDDAEALKRAEAAAAIERRLNAGASVVAPQPGAKVETKPTVSEAAKPERPIDEQPRWVKANGGRIGRNFVLGERIFTRREIQWVMLAASVYMLTVLAFGLVSTLGHQPSITPASEPQINVPGEIQAKELPPLPAPPPPAQANADAG